MGTLHVWDDTTDSWVAIGGPGPPGPPGEGGEARYEWDYGGQVQGLAAGGGGLTLDGDPSAGTTTTLTLANTDRTGRDATKDIRRVRLGDIIELQRVDDSTKYMRLQAQGPAVVGASSTTVPVRVVDYAGAATGAAYQVIGTPYTMPMAPVVRQYGPGNSTWTKPTDRRFGYIEVEVVGPGGGGGGAQATGAGEASGGMGGSAGGYCRRIIPVSALANITTCAIVVGAGGAGGIAGNNPGGDGSADSTFTFGASVISGGKGLGGGTIGNGTSINSASGPAGGAASGGDINIPGQGGGPMNRLPTSPAGTAAVNGGGNPGGGIGLGGVPVGGSGAGNPGTGYGAGGSGGRNGQNQGAFAGGAGAPGRVIVTEYY